MPIARQIYLAKRFNGSAESAPLVFGSFSVGTVKSYTGPRNIPLNFVA